MSLDPISRLSQVMQLIRQQMAERASRLESGSPASTPAPPVRADRQGGIKELKLKVRERINDIRRDDPRRAEKVQRAFLESVLTWQFGPELMLDRSFEEIVSGVQENLRAHPELNARCMDVLDEL